MESAAEDEVVVSPFSVAELWQRLPALLVEETFGYFTLQNASRLCGVGTTWKSLLSHLAVISNGILFFRQPKREACHANEGGMFWDGLSQFRQGTIKHIVLQEFFPSPHTYVHSDQEDDVMDFGYGDGLELLDSSCRAVRQTHQPVDTVTFYKGVCHPVLQSTPPGASGVNWLFRRLATLQSVRFVRCKVRVQIAYVPRTERKTKDFSGWDWSLWMELPLKVFPKEEVEQLESDFRNELHRRTQYLNIRDFEGGEEKYRHRYDGIEYEMRRHWFMEFCLEPKSMGLALMWPYPVGQLHWLKAALHSLDGPTRTHMSDAYESYRSWMDYRMYQPGKNGDPEENWRGNWHVATRSDFKKEWQVEVDIRWGTSDRKLDVIDSAFMAQLLSIMPGVPEPPYHVPFDFKAREDWRRTPTPEKVLVELERDITQFKLRTSALLE